MTTRHTTQRGLVVDHRLVDQRTVGAGSGPVSALPAGGSNSP